MKKIIITLLIFITFINIVLGDGEIIDGNKVYINNSIAYISAEPQHLIRDGYVNFNLISKQYSGDMNVMFGFNSENAIPKSIDLYSPHYEDVDYLYQSNLYEVSNFRNTLQSCDIGNGINKMMVDTVNNTDVVVCYDIYFNEGNNYTITWTETVNEYKEYLNLNNIFNKANLELDNKDVWYYVKDKPIIAGEEIKFRMYLDLIGGEGKYDIAFFPSSYGNDYLQAYNDGNMLLLDPTYNLTDNIIGYWKFDGNATDSLGVNNGTVTGATNDDLYGIINEGYNFNGISDYINLGNAVIPITGNWTISIWVKMNNNTIPDIWNTIISQYAGSTGRFLMRCYSNADNTFFYSFGGGSTAWKSVEGGSSSDISMGVWHNLVLMTAGTSIKFYIEHYRSLNVYYIYFELICNFIISILCLISP